MQSDTIATQTSRCECGNNTHKIALEASPKACLLRVFGTHDDRGDAQRRPESLQRSTHEDEGGEGGGTAGFGECTCISSGDPAQRFALVSRTTSRATDGSVLASQPLPRPRERRRGPGARLSACAHASAAGGCAHPPPATAMIAAALTPHGPQLLDNVDANHVKRADCDFYVIYAGITKNFAACITLPCSLVDGRSKCGIRCAYAA